MIRVKERKTCRVSNGPLVDILDLGNLPFSTFPKPGEYANLAPLPLKLCINQESKLVQLRHTVDPDAMYSEYWYMSGVNQSMTLALKSIVQEALKRVGKELKKGDIVVDIASNDGTLLSGFPGHFFRIGIDPAKNIRPKVCDLHINTYFSARAYKKEMGDKKAQIVTSIAMFYDLEDPVQFSRDVAEILDEKGLWIIELSYLPTMLKTNSFDTICSEHLEYYSLESIEYILRQTGFAIEDVELNNVNGGSFRVYVRHASHAKETEAVRSLRLSEVEMKLGSLQTYIDFSNRVQKNKQEMLAFLKKQKERGKKVFAYGASTKGNSLLAYYGIGPDLVPFATERNPIKWGRQTVTGIPIISEAAAREMKPDYFLALPYHFISEFLRREGDFLKGGGKFVLPVPSLTIVP